MIKVYDELGNPLKYKHIIFPDSQQSVEFEEVPKKSNWRISARLSDFRQVELLLAVVGAIKAITPSCKINLNIVYLLGGRSDRHFSKHSPHYLRDVIAPVINQLNLTEVRILDPHSDVSEAVFKKCRPFSALHVLLGKYLTDKKPTGAIQIVVPDAGAEKRIIKTIADYSKLTNEPLPEIRLIQCIKTRDLATGAITGLTVCQNQEVDFELPTVVIDDLCDGGKTFIEIADKVMVKDLALIVAHGIFSKGIDPILAEYNRIYTTNSFKEFPETQTDVDVFHVI